VRLLLSFITPGNLIAFAAFALLPLGVAAPHAIAILLPIVAIIASLSQWLQKRPFPISSRKWFLFIGIFHLWIFASVIWSPIPSLSLHYAAKVALTTAWGLLLIILIEQLDEKQRGCVGKAFLWGGMATIVLLIFHLATAYYMSWLQFAGMGAKKILKAKLIGFNRASSLLCLSTWLSLFFLNAQRKPALFQVIFILAQGAAIFLLESDAARFALLTGMALWGLCRSNLINFKGAAIFLTLLWIVGSPFIIKAMGLPERGTHNSIVYRKHSYDHRLFIWHDLSQHVFEKPIIGHGFASTRYSRSPAIYPKTFEAGFQIPTHPHNAPLEIWGDLGAIGAILFSLIILLIPLGTYKLRDNSAKACLLALFVSGLILCQVSYGFWQIWWLSSLWFLGAFARMVYRDSLLLLNKAKKASE
jgi:O-antigen ligase